MGKRIRKRNIIGELRDEPLNHAVRYVYMSETTQTRVIGPARDTKPGSVPLPYPIIYEAQITNNHIFQIVLQYALQAS